MSFLLEMLLRMLLAVRPRALHAQKRPSQRVRAHFAFLGRQAFRIEGDSRGAGIVCFARATCLWIALEHHSDVFWVTASARAFLGAASARIVGGVGRERWGVKGKERCPYRSHSMWAVGCTGALLSAPSARR